ncbi:hypothetical protein HY338_01440 [Candidatus Gottesmanbacteria bacterium]|nr:hypothetical protein [Candidatus Gottesmanbacteria bacterium]
MKDKKDNKRSLLLILAIISLITIATILLMGFLQTKKVTPTSSNQVLGEIAQSNDILIPSPTSFVQDMVKNTLNNTQTIIENYKNTLTEKVVEVEKNILQNAKDQVNTLTQSQIKTIQTQICTDWGVIKP